MPKESRKGEENSMNKWWIQMLITIVAMVIGVGVAWGAITTRVNALEKRVDSVQPSMQSDHDVLISVSTKMDLMMNDVGEVKRDLKRHIEDSGRVNVVDKASNNLVKSAKN